ncbi:hypothetical protein AAMO2058_001140400 [Amorphochlora amoebiformis]|uniref:FAD-binding FR-type domain-containing protein n=2 Tax=Amorphochlora amoebiformis TaxID=1561963 RepID=A0A7S0H3X1_9EUKA|mmetsp:Transcript_33683/g.54235  ORF Transcript_33683/g.54235 Transcript_33683/m.54235 type:complete len:836 (+) Transcript_33683:73-2580(+)
MDTQEVYEAIWDFNATDSQQISFRKGERITLLGKDPTGWWLGEIERKGQRVEGLFPFNRTRLVQSSVIGEWNGFESPRQNTVIVLDTKQKPPPGRRRRQKSNKKPTARTVFRVWAHKQVKWGCGVGLIMFGLLAMHYGAAEKVGDITDVGVGVVAAGSGALLLAYETAFEGEPITSLFPARALLWVFLAAICFVSFPLWTIALFLLVASFIEVVGFLRSEQWVEPKKRRKSRKDKEIAEENAHMSYWDKFYSWLVHKHEENKLQRMIFCMIFFAANLALFIYTAIIWTAAVEEMDEDKKLSSYAPFAKAFGAVIDLNSSLLLIPVCRTIIRLVYNSATSGEGCCAWFVRGFFNFIPLDKNIYLHKTLAKISLFAVVGHTIFHFINYSIKPQSTLDRFGWWPFYSGVILLLICQLIYTGAFEDVKRPTFEIFWYSHHLFIFYFLITLLHGAGGFNPNFWKYFAIPGLLYILERAMRYRRGKRMVIVKSVMTMEPNLLSIEMDKKSAFGEAGFREGQYVFVNCPSVKPYEWHPFTISSPPQKDTFTLHIQTQGPGSWTEGVKEYLMSMGPKDRTFFEFKRRNNMGQIEKGKVIGPNGLQLLLIDGPHSAPTQHMSEYEAVMIAGAGIGLTPVIACAESIVYHRWKFGMGKVFPSHAHFYWCVSHRDIEAYRWFVVKVVECQNAVINMRKKSDTMKDKTFRFIINITSVPKSIKANYVSEVMEDEKHDPDFWGGRANIALGGDSKGIQNEKAAFDKSVLYRWMLDPKEKEKKFEDITVIVGRPKWGKEFKHVSAAHKDLDVGVMFCGNRFIGKDLKRMCAQFSSVERKQYFKLHKENF